MSGQGFQFTPDGFVPLVATENGAVPGGELIPFEADAPASKQEAKIAGTAAKVKSSKVSMGPRDVIKSARARVREIKAELKSHARLKRELAELERLLKAAKEKPSNLRVIARTG